MAAWPGKLKATKVTDRVVRKVTNITKSAILSDIEVKKTLERIRLLNGKYDRDGIEFRNDQLFLPQKQKWYYTEWTVDTPWLNHRWEKRIVVGSNWEQYYTWDHYKTKEWFIKIK